LQEEEIKQAKQKPGFIKNLPLIATAKPICQQLATQKEIHAEKGQEA
jgi:hypothetical protein